MSTGGQALHPTAPTQLLISNPSEPWPPEENTLGRICRFPQRGRHRACSRHRFGAPQSGNRGIEKLESQVTTDPESDQCPGQMRAPSGIGSAESDGPMHPDFNSLPETTSLRYPKASWAAFASLLTRSPTRSLPAKWSTVRLPWSRSCSRTPWTPAPTAAAHRRRSARHFHARIPRRSTALDRFRCPGHARDVYGRRTLRNPH